MPTKRDWTDSGIAPFLRYHGGSRNNRPGLGVHAVTRDGLRMSRNAFREMDRDCLTDRNEVQVSSCRRRRLECRRILRSGNLIWQSDFPFSFRPPSSNSLPLSLPLLLGQADVRPAAVGPTLACMATPPFSHSCTLHRHLVLWPLDLRCRIY